MYLITELVFPNKTLVVDTLQYEIADETGLFLGTAIHETSQVAAAGLIYDQQFNSPETLNVATVTKLIRNTFLVYLKIHIVFLLNFFLVVF